MLKTRVFSYAYTFHTVICEAQSIFPFRMFWLPPDVSKRFLHYGSYHLKNEKKKLLFIHIVVAKSRIGNWTWTRKNNIKVARDNIISCAQFSN